jgi:gas vesicle protein
MDDHIYSARMRDRIQQERAKNTVTLLFMGLALGAILALLFAPKSGDKTRAEITQMIEERLGRKQMSPTEQAIKTLEREFGRLREQVEDRIAELR